MLDIHIIGGGTVFHVRNHLALTAPAYGSTARTIFKILNELPEVSSAFSHSREYGSSWPDDVPWTQLHLTKMANSGEGNLETNEDVSNLLDQIIADPVAK